MFQLAKWGYGIIALLLLHLPLSGQAQLKLEFLSSTTGGPVSHAVWHEGFVVAACGASLCVYDARPGKQVPYKRVFDKALGARINDLKLRRSQLFLALNDGSVSRWNLNNPMVPLPNGLYKPNHFDAAAHDITLTGDSLIVAYADRVLILRELNQIGAQFDLLGEFANQVQMGGSITGGDLRGNWYALVTAWQGKYYSSALHLYDLNTKERIHFYPRTFSNARDVMWDDQHDLLHILGGTTTKGDSGLYYAVMVGERGGLREVFADSIPKGLVTGAIKRDDTLFVAAGKGNRPNCARGALYAYQVIDSVQVNFLGKCRVNKGVTLTEGPDRLLVAGGEKGLQVLTKWAPDQRPCGNRGISSQTLTGGGNTSSDAFGERLVLAAPGHGLSLFNISNPRNPVPTRDAPFAPFAHIVKFSEDGKYLYLVEKGGKGEQNRVVIRDAQSFEIVGQTTGPWGFEEACFWDEKAYILREARDGIDIVDLSKPNKPVKKRSILMPVNDLYIGGSGVMLVSSRHNLRVFDLKGDETKERVAVTKWDQGFGETAIWDDEVFVYVRKRGLVKYQMSKENGKWQLKELFVIKPPKSHPDQLLAHQGHLFIGYSGKGVYALERAKLHLESQWQTDGAFMAYPGTGLRDLFVKENFLYVVQFFAQTSILNLKEE